MNATSFEMERSIARCRVFLSLISSVVMYIDPSTGGAFSLGPYWGTVMTAHLIYSLSLWQAQRTWSSPRLATIAACGDVLFAAAVATTTEGTTSPFYSFFAFAVLTVGLRSGLRAALLVTSASVALYVGLVAFVSPAGAAPLPHHARGLLDDHRLPRRLLRRRAPEARRADQAPRGERGARADRALAPRRLRTGARGVNLRLETCRELLSPRPTRRRAGRAHRAPARRHPRAR